MMTNVIIQPFNGIYPNSEMLSEAIFLAEKDFALKAKVAKFEKNKKDTVYVQDNQSNYYIYRITGEEFNLTGLVGLIPHKKFTTNFIMPHEQTLPDKELAYIESFLHLRVQMNPVLLFHRNNTELKLLLESSEHKSKSLLEINDGGLKHEILSISDNKQVSMLNDVLTRVDRLYVADGHHRIKASLLAAKQDATIPEYCLSMIVSADDLRVGGINRCLKSDSCIDIDTLLLQIEKYFDIANVVSTNISKHEYQVYLQGKWYKLRLKKKFLGVLKGSEKLDPSIVENYLLKPVFAIQDQRSDQRLRFIPDSYGHAYLNKEISAGKIDVAICIPPISMDELCNIADNGFTIPPHSTYLQPKALDSIISWRY